MIIGRTEVVNPDAVVVAVKIEMELRDLKVMRAEIMAGNFSRYEVVKMLNVFAEAVRKVEKEFYVSESDATP